MDKTIVQKFHNAYIDANSKELDNLWDNYAPKTVLKFFSGKYTEQGDNYFLESIIKKSLWLSSPRLFNDPFDCLINCDYTDDIKFKINSVFKPILDNCQPKKPYYDVLFQIKLEELYSQYNEEMNSSNREWERKMFIACFAEKDTITSSRMWGHYANNHMGICAEYDWADVRDASPFACLPVKYTNTYEYIPNPTSDRDGTKNFMKFYTKAEEWEYEKEWRVAQQLDCKCNGISVPFNLPRKVYLGCRISEKLKNDVVSICALNNIEVYQMRIKPNSYSLEFDKIEE